MNRKLGILIVLVVATLVLGVFFPKKLASGHSQSIMPDLVLEKIKMHHEQEMRGGDELYVTISVMRNGHLTESIRIPSKPDHWLSRQIELIKDIHLWSEPITVGEYVTLLIELNDQDALPLNPDDALGVVQLQLKNDKGFLKSHWDMPSGDFLKKSAVKKADTFSNVSGQTQRFEILHAGAHYEMYLSIK